MTESEGHSPELPSDPSGIDEPHDILAAEEFGIGTRDERYPADPSGIQEPHDVLAAEEFPMPAGACRSTGHAARQHAISAPSSASARTASGNILS